MAWKIEFDRDAERELLKLDPPVAKRVLSFLFNRVANWMILVILEKLLKDQSWDHSGNIGLEITGLLPVSNMMCYVFWL